MEPIDLERISIFIVIICLLIYLFPWIFFFGKALLDLYKGGMSGFWRRIFNIFCMKLELVSFFYMIVVVHVDRTPIFFLFFVCFMLFRYFPVKFSSGQRSMWMTELAGVLMLVSLCARAFIF